MIRIWCLLVRAYTHIVPSLQLWIVTTFNDLVCYVWNVCVFWNPEPNQIIK